jgi:hypothetical protein
MEEENETKLNENKKNKIIKRSFFKSFVFN